MHAHLALGITLTGWEALEALTFTSSSSTALIPTECWTAKDSTLFQRGLTHSHISAQAWTIKGLFKSSERFDVKCSISGQRQHISQIFTAISSWEVWLASQKGARMCKGGTSFAHVHPPTLASAYWSPGVLGHKVLPLRDLLGCILFPRPKVHGDSTDFLHKVSPSS